MKSEGDLCPPSDFDVLNCREVVRYELLRETGARFKPTVYLVQLNKA